MRNVKLTKYYIFYIVLSAAPLFAELISDLNLILKARTHYVHGNLITAKNIFQCVLENDPNSIIAKTYLDQIDRDIFKIGQNNQHDAKRDMLLEVDCAWDRPIITNSLPNECSNLTRANPITKKLQLIKIPKINLTNVLISNVVAMLSELSIQYDTTENSNERTGVNIVLIDPVNQNPSITLSLRDVSLEQVLDAVTKSANFSYDIENDLVTIRPGVQCFSNLQTEFFPITRATIIRMTNYCHTESFYKNPASAISTHPAQIQEEIALKNFFQRAGVPFDPDIGGPIGAQFAFDGSQFIVTQSFRNIQKIRNILARYKDIRQVEIEAKFIEVQEGVLEELGVRWSITSRSQPDKRFFQSSKHHIDNLRTLSDAFNPGNSSSGNGKIVFKGTSATPTNDPIFSRAPVFPNCINVGLQSVPVAGILTTLSNWDLNLIIEALEQHTGADLLSAPKLTVLSGKTAKITIAQVLRYPEAFGDIQSAVGTAGVDPQNSSAGVTITAGTPQHFVEKNVGVEMEVTPTVEDDNKHISLKLDPRVTEFEGFVEYGGRSIAISGDTTVEVPSGFFQPIFSTREIQTEVTIANGSTIVMGGLTREEVKTVEDKIPILGEIPFLGKLFCSKGETNQKRNLLIFITANIITTGGVPAQNSLPCLPQRSLFQEPVKITPSGIATRQVSR